MSKLLFAELTHENDIKNSILDWLNMQPKTKAFRRNVGAAVGEYKGKRRFIRFNMPGMSDIWAISNSRHAEIEIKMPGKPLTLAQEQWLTDCAKLGAFCFVADDLDAFIAEWRKAGL